TMYLLPDVNMSLRPKILELKPGTRVVSHAFDMDDWEADHYERVDGRSVYLWVVPAKAEGRWKLEGPDGAMDLELSQDLQKLSGTLRDAKGQSQAVTGALRGKAIRVTVGGGGEARTFTGTVEGGSMLLAAAGTSKQEWKGSRQRAKESQCRYRPQRLPQTVWWARGFRCGMPWRSSSGWSWVSAS